VSDRLSPLDVSFLYLEEPTTPMHVGGVLVFDPPAARPSAGPEDPPAPRLDYDSLVRRIGNRIGLVPRFRQKIRWVPGHLANPVWVDDDEFDVSYHVRRSALPRPGTMPQLRELAGRVQARALDRNRPLWEIYVVEGLEHGRTGIITKTHHAMVDGVSAVDLGSVLLDLSPDAAPPVVAEWSPRQPPSPAGLVAAAAAEWLRRPAAIVDTVRGGVTDARANAGRATRAVGGVLSTLRTTVRSAPSSPLNADIGQQRRFGTADTDLDDYKRVRKHHGGTVNDVVLATVSGALRAWLLTRGEPVTPATVIRAMVPVSVRPAGPADGTGNRVASYFVDLPVGEPSPVVRLQRVSFEMRGHKDSNQAVGAQALVAMAGFAPPTVHALASRVASGLSRRLFNVVVTNVPGPQFPLYMAGGRLLSMYPVVPLSKGQAVSIGLTSYDGGVFYGLNADRDAMPDVDVLAGCLVESLAELVGTVP
jgi:diacylglycerol O-acyltransferase